MKLDRYWIIFPPQSNEDLEKLWGIVDEDAGGIIAYTITESNAIFICKALTFINKFKFIKSLFNL